MHVPKIFRRLPKFLSTGTRKKPLSTQRWLEKRRVRCHSVSTQVIDDSKVESTEQYLSDRGIGKTSLKAETAETLRIREAKHRLGARTAVLMSLLVPMSIAPFWLMVLLTLPALGRTHYSEGMQAAFLAALVSDFVGLYHVITRDLFPQGSDAPQAVSQPKSQPPNAAQIAAQIKVD
ncbi:MAG TPA: hypothetical protein V6C84_21765 [Coleofasciculaceae cyanobacterium]